ncbi:MULTISPECIES: hypothetical protein [Flavobacteriaceae]|jgi:hypothetical protein|uniref:Uncharacterized protein n=1 Tax=Galbibacter orientalis DSM 19592 TaxID=926559 RepID=I3C0G5_9FLAO|nr:MULTISPECIES: hypothetical protein [Flavobacteriaceae]EIJ37108.1 hypothetical protein JoomaDRAFT_0046 [Galbibacter orientalis DSM 19592]MCC4228548.1 hypothetical protein [Zunongwangia profunda]
MNKNFTNKYSHQLIIILICCLTSCKALEYGHNYPATSKFNDIETLTYSKEDFITTYGEPTCKTIETLDNIPNEKLFYVEKLKNVVVTTQFIFINDTIKKMEIFKIEENIQPYMDSLRREIRINRLKE